MNKGFIFAITFSMLFLLLLGFAAGFLESFGLQRLDAARAKAVDKQSFVQDDVAADLLSYLQADITISGNNTTTVEISDSLPAPYSDPSQELNDWISYISNSYAPGANVNVSINASDFTSSPRIIFSPFNLSYQYDSLSKNTAITHGNSSVRNYSLTASLGKEPASVNASNWSWSGSPTSLYITLNISGPSGTPVNVSGATGGYINPNSNNGFWLNLSTGAFYVNAGNYSSYGTHSLRATVENASASMQTGITLNATPQRVTAWVPVLVRVDNVSESYAIVGRG